MNVKRGSKASIKDWFLFKVLAFCSTFFELDSGIFVLNNIFVPGAVTTFRIPGVESPRARETASARQSQKINQMIILDMF